MIDFILSVSTTLDCPQGWSNPLFSAYRTEKGEGSQVSYGTADTSFP